MDKIFRIIGDAENFHSLAFSEANEYLFDLIQKMPFSPIGNVWFSPKIEIYFNEKISKTLLLSDCPFLLSNSLVLREKLYKDLQDVLGKDLEILPLDFNGSDSFCMINPFAVVDALDFSESAVEFYKDRVLYVDNYVLIRRNIPSELPIFRVKGAEGLALFVNESVFLKISSLNLTGFLFSEIRLT